MTASAVVVIAGARGATGWAGPVFAGMIGPLVAVVATSVMGVAATAFLAKVIFFVAYVAAAIKLAGLPAREFGLSFVAWFIALYAAQAVLMRRLFREGLKGARK